MKTRRYVDGCENTSEAIDKGGIDTYSLWRVVEVDARPVDPDGTWALEYTLDEVDASD